MSLIPKIDCKYMNLQSGCKPSFSVYGFSFFSQLKTQRKACTHVDTFLPHQVRVAACSCQRFPSAFLWSARSDDGLVNDQILCLN
jgi:hypothetical protein